MEVKEKFEAVNDEYLKFDNIEKKLSTRPDIHAFILLNSIAPKGRDIISAASHDVIYLDFDNEMIMCLSDEYILDLVRCGVMYSEGDECFSMFT